MDKKTQSDEVSGIVARGPMRRHGMRSLTGALALVITTVLVACGGSDDAGGDDGGSNSASSDSGGGERMAFLGIGANNSYTQAAWKAAEKQAKEDGHSIRFFDGQFDGQKQYSQMQDALASGQYKAILVMPIDGASLVPLAKQANDKDVQVLSLEHTIGQKPTEFRTQVPGVISIGYSAPERAAMVAEDVVDRCKKLNPCRVVLMYGDRTTLFDQVRANAVKDVFAKHSNIKVLATVDGAYLPDKSMAAMQDVISAHGKKIDIVASPSGDQQIDGAERALKQRGGVGKIVLVGQAGSEVGIARVKDGSWATTQVSLPATIGQMGAEYANKIFKGESVPEITNMAGKSDVGDQRDMVTKESLEKDPEFIGEWAG